MKRTTLFYRMGLILLSLAAASLLIVGCGSGGDQSSATLRYSAIPDQNTTELAEKYAPLTRYLSEALGVPVV